MPQLLSMVFIRITVLNDNIIRLPVPMATNNTGIVHLLGIMVTRGEDELGLQFRYQELMI